MGTHQFAAPVPNQLTVVSLAADYGAVERAYVGWVHRFIERLSARLPDETASGIIEAANIWVHQCDRLTPEEAAEIAAMWWPAHSQARTVVTKNATR